MLPVVRTRESSIERESSSIASLAGGPGFQRSSNRREEDGKNEGPGGRAIQSSPKKRRPEQPLVVDLWTPERLGWLGVN